jgi:hypothetical protein
LKKEDSMNSMKLFQAVLVIMAILASLPVWAQRRMQEGAKMRPGASMIMMKYDPATEVTLTGTIEEVSDLECPDCPRGMRGTHIQLKTREQSIEVHVGPTSYLADQKFTLAKNDEIEVTGSKIKHGNTEVLLAREVKKGGNVLTLRNSQGVPQWSMGTRNR